MNHHEKPTGKVRVSKRGNVWIEVLKKRTRELYWKRQKKSNRSKSAQKNFEETIPQQCPNCSAGLATRGMAIFCPRCHWIRS